jgi:hypothetical protein
VAKQTPGAVVVAQVHPGTPAEGKLVPGDRIIGIDGRLLDIDSPNADLRRLFMESEREPGPSLRVERDIEVFDIVLAVPRDAIPKPVFSLGPGDSVKDLAALCRAVRFMSLHLDVSQDRAYAAKISLRFAPLATTMPAAVQR